MLKGDDVLAIVDYCRGLGNSVRKAGRVFQRSRNTVARVLKEGVEGIRPGEVRHERLASGGGCREVLGV